MLLARCRAEIRRGLYTQSMPEYKRAGTQAVLEIEPRPACSRREELARLARRAQKLDRYQQVLELREQGLTTAAIGPQIGISGRTVQRWLANSSFPEARRRRRRPSLIDPYERYVLHWWHEGNHNGLQLYRDLRAQGYKGSSKAIYRYLERLRTPHRPVPLEAAQTEEGPGVTGTTAKLLGPARHLAVCVSPREAGRGTAPGAGLDPTSQSHCRGRLPPGTSVYADDPRADRAPTGELAGRGRSKPLARVSVIGPRHSPRPSGCAGRLDAALK